MKKNKFVLAVFIFIFGLVLSLCVPREPQSFHVDDEETDREQADFIVPSQEVEDMVHTESLKAENEEPETEWIPDVREIKVYVTTQKDIDKIGELTTLESLDIDIWAEEIDLSPLGKLNHLRKLSINLVLTGTMDLSFIEQLSSLEYLTLDGFTNIDDLAFLERLTTLSEIHLEYVEDVDLSYLQNNHELLRIHICGGNIRHLESLGQLNWLSRVYLVETREERNEREVLNLEVMSNMKSLRELSLTSVRVDDVSPLRNLDELRFIHLEDTGIEDIEPLKDLKNLSTLKILGNESELVKKQAETYFNHVPDMYISEEMDFILPSQEIGDTLNTESLKTEKEEPDTEWITDVREINIHVTTQKDIDKISELTTLESLYINISAEGMDLSPLGKLNNLRKLTIILDPDDAVDLSFIEQLSSLEYLELYSLADIDDLAFLEKMPTLREIYIRYVEDVDLSYLQNNYELQVIHICGGNIRHMESLGQLERVERVYLEENNLLYGEEKNEREVLNLEVMSNMKSLRELNLTSVRVDDVSPLRNLDELQFIHLEDTGIENIEPLKDLKSLRSLHVMGNDSELVKKQASKYFNHVPHVNVTEEMSP